MEIDKRLKFRHLACFLEVASQRSLARAADRMAISQPAVSKTLKELEDVLQVRLFDRGPRSVELTQAGLTLLRHAAPGMKAVAEGVASVRQQRPRAGSVRIGVLSTVESEVIPAVIRRLHAQHAGLVVEVVTGSSAYLLSRLRVGELEVVVGRMAEAREIHGLAFEHLYNDTLLLAVRSGHPLLNETLDDPAILGRYPFVLPLEGTVIRHYTDAFLAGHGIPMPDNRLETISPALSRRYVLDTDAVWFAPADSVEADVKAGDLAVLPVSMESRGGSIGLCRNISLQTTPAVEAFCDCLRAVCADLPHSF